MEDRKPVQSGQAHKMLPAPLPPGASSIHATEQGLAEEPLEAQLPALRRLALRILRQPAPAEDVVHDVCLAALMRPEEERHNLAPWLVDAVRRLASRARRGERRRREREARAARRGAQPSAAEVVAELEVLMELHRRVAKLQEPYRTAIHRRFFDGLAPRSVAAALDLPVETVRTHLKRALEELRRDLETTGHWKARDGGPGQPRREDSPDSVNRKRPRRRSR